MALANDDYQQQWLALLPYGPAWPRDAGYLPELALAHGDGLARAHQRADDLLREADPRTTLERLPEWERDLGLPDECSVPGTQTVAERRAAVLGKLLASGGQSIAYYTNVLANYGYPDVRIEEFTPHAYGRIRCGQRYGHWLWRRVWRIHLPSTRWIKRQHGNSSFGEPYSVFGDATLACILNRIKPAHTLVQLVYGDF